MHTDVGALNGSLGSTESQTNVLVPSSATLSNSLALGLGLGVGENVRLLLESALRLDGQLGRHVCDISVRHSEFGCRAGGVSSRGLGVVR